MLLVQNLKVPPENVIASYSNAWEFFLVTLTSVKKTQHFLRHWKSQILNGFTLSKFTAQNIGLRSNAELVQLWSRVIFHKHCDTGLQLLRKSLGDDSAGPSINSQSTHSIKHSYAPTISVVLYVFDCLISF